MKILFVLNHFFPCIGGIERISFDLAEALSKKELQVSVACLNKCSKGGESLREYEEINGIKINRLPFINLKYYLIPKNLLKLLKLVEQNDIIHIHGFSFMTDFLLLTKPFHKRKIIISTHGGFFHTQNLLFFKKIYFNLILPVLLTQAHKVLAVSRQDYVLFKNILSLDKIKLLENTINEEKFSKFSGKKEKNTFLFTGRLSENKRIDLLLKSFVQTTKRIHAAKLFIVGPDWNNNLSKLKVLSLKLGVQENVFFEGSKSEEELLKYYGKSEFFISASDYEGFGLSVLEAVACQCIPILNKISAFRDLIMRGEGVLVDFHSENAGNEITDFCIDKECIAKARKNIDSRKSKKSMNSYIDALLNYI